MGVGKRLLNQTGSAAPAQTAVPRSHTPHSSLRHGVAGERRGTHDIMLSQFSSELMVVWVFEECLGLKSRELWSLLHTVSHLKFLRQSVHHMTFPCGPMAIDKDGRVAKLIRLLIGNTFCIQRNSLY